MVVKDVEHLQKVGNMVFKAQHFMWVVQMYMEMLVVIEACSEEGSGGTVCMTLLLNCTVVLVKVHALLDHGQ